MKFYQLGIVIILIIIINNCCYSYSEEDYPVPKIDPVALEATECLYHWKNQLYKLYSVSIILIIMYNVYCHFLIILYCYSDRQSTEIYSDTELHGRCLPLEMGTNTQ